MARRKGISWKRATGITKAKRNIAKVTGIPTTKSGRKRKVQRVLLGKKSSRSTGCLTLLLPLLFFLLLGLFLIII